MDSDYPDYYPPFMRDFHDQKDLIKAFYVFMEMLDRKRDVEDKPMPSRTEMCSWIDFQVLMVTFLDFVHRMGWTLQRCRKNEDHVDTEETIRSLKELGLAWMEIESPILMSKEQLISTIEEWKNSIPYMPPNVVKCYQELKKL